MSSVIRSDSSVAHMPQTEPLAAAASTSGVSWAAALAGAISAAALSLLLIVLGAGLGLSSVSPWSNRGMSAGAFGVSTIVWLTFTQIVASGLGGYLAGRLRTHWSRLHTDEVYFRDTAQGLLSWSLATLATAALMGSVIGNAVGTGAKVASTVAAGAADVVSPPATGSGAGSTASGADASSGWTAYWVDALLRMEPTATASNGGPNSLPMDPPAAGPTTPAPLDANELASLRAEATRIALHGLPDGRLAPADVTYLGRMVARRNGTTQAAAEAHVNDVFAKLKKSAADAADMVRTKADQARKAAAYSSLWTFVALLAGAFVSAICATLGGRRRDQMALVR
ncbi:MAG: hypothetical protein ACM3VZ_14185 [Acidobacteriota bacterium]